MNFEILLNTYFEDINKSIPHPLDTERMFALVEIILEQRIDISTFLEDFRRIGEEHNVEESMLCYLAGDIEILHTYLSNKNKKYQYFNSIINSSYEYPDDMEKILSHLSELKKPLHTTEYLYREFCHNKHCLEWIDVDDEILEEFVDWLNENNII